MTILSIPGTRRFGRSWIADKRAIGLPALAIVISSPAWTRSRSFDRWVLASWMLTGAHRQRVD